MTDRREQAALLALTEVSPAPWHEVADLVEDAGSVMAVVEGTAQSYTQKGTELLAELVRQTTPAMVDSWISTIEMTLEQLPDASLITVLDPEYPENLRRIYNRPPFLFVRGHLIDEDNRSVAVVGTRRASPEGRKRARFLATALAQRGVTVVSGLAAGIDTSAHSGALDGGGRTVAVMGTGRFRAIASKLSSGGMRGKAAVISITLDTCARGCAVVG